MEFRLFLVIAIAAAAQAASVQQDRYYMFNKNSDKEFVGAITLRNFVKYLLGNFEYTAKCYENIQDEYRQELEKFQNGTSVEISNSADFFFYDKGSYKEVAQEALEELQTIAELMLTLERRLRYFFRDGDNRLAWELYKDTKAKVEYRFSRYLALKKKLNKRPKTKPGLFRDYYSAFDRTKYALAIDNLHRRFQHCMDEAPEDNF